MAIPLKKWHRLGKKTFWLFLLNSGNFFLVLFSLALWFTYSISFTDKKTSFENFFINHPNLYIDGQFVVMMLWLTLLGYFMVVILRAWVLYRQYKFMLDENAFYVRRGIFFIKEVVIPYRQIQNVEIKRPYLYRFIGLAQLDTTTIGGESAILTSGKKKRNLLPIVDYHIAKALAHELVHRGGGSGTSVTEDEDSINQINEIR
jgi:membrane protein YdbS with pleckstrin-like domain